MRTIVAKCFVALGAGIAVMMAQGCKKQAAAAPNQPIVRNVPRVQPDFPVGSLPPYIVDSGTRPSVDRVQIVRPQEQPVPGQNSDEQAGAVAAAQRREDARLLEEQQGESQKQQQELNQEVEQETKRQEEMEAEPRIQDVPEVELPMQLALPQ